MSEFKFGYKSPSHEIEIQIPVCLLGKPESDLIPSIKQLIGHGQKENINEPEEKEEEKPSGFFKHKSKDSETIEEHNGDKLTIATGIMLLSAMILSAMKE